MIARNVLTLAALSLLSALPVQADAQLVVNTAYRANVFVNHQLVGTGLNVSASLPPGSYLVGVVDEVNRTPVELRVTSPMADLVQRVVDVDARGGYTVTSSVLERRAGANPPPPAVRVERRTVVVREPYYVPGPYVYERRPSFFFRFGGHGGRHGGYRGRW